MLIKFKKEPTPFLKISEVLFNKLLSLINSTDLEMCMVLNTKRIDTFAFEVLDLLIPPQWNEGAETKTIDSKYPQWCVEQMKKGYSLKCHLHTHPHMSVTPSGYDNTFFNNLINETNTYQIRLIINHKGLITVDIIDNENNYIATECYLVVVCKAFNLFINDKEWQIKITDPKNVKIEGITENLTAILGSEYLVIKDTNIDYTDTKEVYKPVRRSETDERATSIYYNQHQAQPLLHTKLTANVPSEDDDWEDDPYYQQYLKERGYY